MSTEEGYKRIYAEDLALGIGFEWNYQDAEDHDLYEAIEAMDYSWDGTSWCAPGARRAEPKLKKPRKKRVSQQELLRQWNAGEKKPGGLGQPQESVS